MPAKSSPNVSVSICSGSEAVLSMDLDFQDLDFIYGLDMHDRLSSDEIILEIIEGNSDDLLSSKRENQHRHETGTELMESENGQLSDNFIQEFERMITEETFFERDYNDDKIEFGGGLMDENAGISSEEWIWDGEPPSDQFLEFPPIPGHQIPTISHLPSTNLDSLIDTENFAPPKLTPPTDLGQQLFKTETLLVTGTEIYVERKSIASDSETNSQQEKERITSLNSQRKSTTVSSNTKAKTKRRQIIIDEFRICEPTDCDVLFGRGASTNKHPGNIKFREEALKLRDWYESATKKQKEQISQVLVETVQGKFLKKGHDGLWHEVIHGARRKASQTFRDL